MPGRRPTPLSDELFSTGPGPVLLGATNNGMPLPVKNTFVDMPSGLTPASMKHDKPHKGMKSAPADLNLRSQGFLRRALQEVVAELEAREEAPDEQCGCDDSFCTPPATPAAVASEFLSPGVTPAARQPSPLLSVAEPHRTPQTVDACTAASLTAPALSWGHHAGARAAASVQASGATQQVPPVLTGQPVPLAQTRVLSTPIAVPMQAPAQVPVPGQEMAPAEKLLLLEEAWRPRTLTTIADTSFTKAIGKDRTSADSLADDLGEQWALFQEDMLDSARRQCGGAAAHALGLAVSGCLSFHDNPDHKKHKRDCKRKAKAGSNVHSSASETQANEAAAAMHSLAPPPVQSPRLASMLDNSTPPPPIQSPKLRGDP